MKSYKLARFWKKIFLKIKILPIARFLLLVPIGSQKYRKILIFLTFEKKKKTYD
jgi:hypothetical protein